MRVNCFYHQDGDRCTAWPLRRCYEGPHYTTPPREERRMAPQNATELDEIYLLAVKKSYGWDHSLIDTKEKAELARVEAEKVHRDVQLAKFVRYIKPPLNPCPYTQSHTRDWCGFKQCRES